MFRTVRPAWSSANRLRLAGRAPHVRQAQLQVQGRFPSSKLPAGRIAPLISRVAYSSKTPLQPSPQEIKEQEKKIAQQPLEARPDEVSSQSTVRPLLEQSQAPKPQGEEDFLKGLKGDVHTFQEAFALDKVPREPYVLGLAGTLPYMGTSLATLYLSWNLNTEWPTSSNFLNSILFSHESASQWLHLLEPIQVAYGAVILSFLGAIHWGLEFAEKSSAYQRTRFRYAMGVLAPAFAWPTVFLPVEFALTAQFLGFTGLYFADSRATARGWAPQWYGTYRWVLTAVVGAAIFVSLVGRAKVGENHARLRSSELQELLTRETVGEDKRRDWSKEEEKERARLKKEAEEKKKKEEEEKKKQEEEERKKEEGDKKKGGKDKKKDGDQKGDGEGSMGGKEKENKDKDARKGAKGHVGGGENNEEVGQTESGEGKRKTEKGKKE